MRKKIIAKVAEEFGMDEKVVNKVYLLYWKFIKDTIKEMPLDLTMNKEEMEKIRSSFNIPSIGKLYTSYERITYLRKYKYKNYDIQENKSSL